MQLRNNTAFLKATLSGKSGATGRSIFHFIINNSVGAVYVDGLSTDNGGDCVILWETLTNAAIDLVIGNCRWENWQNGADFIQTNHSTAGTMGRIIIKDVKAASSGGTIGALVHNTSAVDARMVTHVAGFITQSGYTNLFTDDNYPANNVGYSIKYIGQDFVMNSTANNGILPSDTTYATSPVVGSYFWDRTNSNLRVYGTRDNVFRPSGRNLKVAKSSSYTITDADAGKLFTNAGAAGSITLTLPDIATVGVGFEVIAATEVAYAIVFAPDATDQINHGGAGVSWSSTAAADKYIRVVASGTSTWVAKEQ